MWPDNKSDSFTFHRSSTLRESSSSDSKVLGCRKRLTDKFERFDGNKSTGSEGGVQEDRNDRSVLSVLSLNDTKRVLKKSGEKISKTFNNVRVSFGAFSQKFKIATKRRQILEEGPMTPNCMTPQTLSKTVLGRTPTKLYSPFSIESPQEKENRYPLPETTTPVIQGKTSLAAWQRKRNLLDEIFN